MDRVDRFTAKELYFPKFALPPETDLDAMQQGMDRMIMHRLHEHTAEMKKWFAELAAAKLMGNENLMAFARQRLKQEKGLEKLITCERKIPHEIGRLRQQSATMPTSVLIKSLDGAIGRNAYLRARLPQLGSEYYTSTPSEAHLNEWDDPETADVNARAEMCVALHNQITRLLLLDPRKN